MIKRVYETHLEVKDMTRAIEFYRDKLGLILGHGDETTKAAFFWVGEPGESMLGLWLVPEEEVVYPSHFAFEVDLEFLKQSKKWLEDKGIEVIGSQGKKNREPIVQAWMPAASVYFLDNDGNKLEFISMLPDDPIELGYKAYLSEWMKKVEQHTGKK
jgi:catechol 2,3-dioxygenase-like lactoylglutathione lyase family enzyme